MADYRYVAYNRAGKRRRGVTQAADRAGAQAALREQGLFVTALRERAKGALHIQLKMAWRGRVSTQQFAAFCRQLATLLGAGVTLLQSVRALSEQTDSATLRVALQETGQSLAAGRSLSQAAADRPDVFPPIFRHMTRAGEVSGSLDQVLNRLARYFERQYYTIEKVKSALAYPAVLSGVTVIVTLFLLAKVVPTFVQAFGQLHAALPLPTVIVLAVSGFLATSWWVVLLALAGLIAGHAAALRRRTYRLFLDRLKLRLPVLGPLFQKAAVARMSRTLATLFASAVPIFDGLRIAADVSGNAAIAEALTDAAASLREGGALAQPIGASRVFPPMVGHMIAVGEQSGNLDAMLEKIADFYEAEVDANAERLKSILEPILILVLGGIVGTVVLAVILPYFDILSHIQ